MFNEYTYFDGIKDARTMLPKDRPSTTYPGAWAVQPFIDYPFKRIEPVPSNSARAPRDGMVIC